MALVKCPRCELNYMKEGEKYCTVCSREMRGVEDTHEHVEICLVCGEHPVQPGSELCSQCLREHKRIGEDEDRAYVDDATGAILKIDYYTHENLYPPEEQRFLFEEWTEGFFSGLGLEMNSEYMQSLEIHTKEEKAKDAMTFRYHIQEIQYGLVTVSFTVKPGGFYISFSGSR